MKADLRKEFLKKRDLLSSDEIVARSRVITKKLTELPCYSDALTILFYVSKGSEVHTHPLIKDAFSSKQVLVPKVESSEITCCSLSSFEELSPGRFDVLEPSVCKKVPLSEVDLVLVPGIVFDMGNHRIGYGLGFYDRLLSKVHCPKVGLCYNFQKIDSLPHEKWDERLDLVVTD